MNFSTNIKNYRTGEDISFDIKYLGIDKFHPRFYDFSRVYGDYMGIFTGQELWDMNEQSIAQKSTGSANLRLREFLLKSPREDKFVVNYYEYNPYYL